MTIKSILSCVLLLGISCTHLCLPETVYSQDNVQLVEEFADNLYKKKYYNDSITEYMRVLFWSGSREKSYNAHYKIALCYRELGQFDKSIIFFKRARQYTLKDSLHNDLEIAISVCHIMLGQYGLAQVTLLRLSKSKKFPRQATDAKYLLLTSAVMQRSWPKAYSFANVFDSTNGKIEEILKDAIKHRPKSTHTAKWLSTLLPGAGQYYASDYKNSINAFLINTLNFFVTGYFIFKKDYHNAVLYFALIGERFYTGNIHQAGQSVLKHEKHILDKYYQKIMTKLKTN